MRPNLIPYFFLAFSAVLAAAALALLLFRNPDPQPPKTSEAPPQASVVEQPVPEPEPIESLKEELPPQTPEEIFADLGVGISVSDPVDLLKQINEALEKGDMNAVSRLIGKQALDLDGIAKLKMMLEKQKQPAGIREVGELELNRRARWALEWEGEGQERPRILFDFRKEDGKWIVEKLILPEDNPQAETKDNLPDSLSIADTFLQAVLSQKFDLARTFTEPSTVTDTKIAALCILFEEGGYSLQTAKPLRAMFSRDDTVGYLANVVAGDGSEKAQFAMNLRQAGVDKSWRVSEINLDGLLADYATRIAGGDIYYSPLVRNPAGGETLALYFGFDEETISPRTLRQLEIVAAILKGDATKKITLSGHTDSLGTAEYNDQLSAKRASAVRDFLVTAGVPDAQIITVAKGSSQPRRPNVTETGEDNPEGRRANRRTEIYLDF